MTLPDVLARLKAHRYLAGGEVELQEMLADVMRREGIPFEPERSFGRAGRIDFYLPDLRAGLEVKVQGSPSQVLQQLQRYSGVAEIDALVLVTRRLRLGGLAEAIGGKPLHIIALWEHAL